MKKGKVFSKRHIVSAVLVVCLAGAVWLNMKFSAFNTVPDNTSSNNLADSQYYDKNTNLGEAIQTGGAVDKVATARKERNDKRNKTVEQFGELIKQSDTEETAKNDALKQLNLIAERISAEASVETLIKAKGFSDALAVISDENVTVIVPSEGLLTSETLQIQDAVTSQMKIDLEKIKIIAVK